jgi:hypothetical protein
VSVELAERFVVEPAYPNPFNPSTTVRIGTAERTDVRLILYDTLGKRVRTLYSGATGPNALHVVQIDGADLPSGAYVVCLEGANTAASEQIPLLM